MTEEPNQGGQRLRWWQEEKTAVPVARYGAAESASVVVEDSSHVVDIGQELEEEARTLAAAEARGERVTFLAIPPKNKVSVRLARSAVFLMVAGFGLLPLTMRPPVWYHGRDLYHQPYFWIEWLGLIVWTILCFNGGKVVLRSVDRPGVTLTNAGIEIRAIGYNIGLLKWDEIKSISLTGGYLAIQPRDFRGLCRRLPWGQTALMRANHFLSLPLFFLPERMRAPICVGTHLTVPAGELLKRINEFRARHGV